MTKGKGPMPVLIVDDDPVTRMLLQAHLEEAGHPVIVACSGAEAIACIEKHAPRIIILDWVMPQMDGLQLCRAIRKLHDSRFTYLIMLTVHSDKDQLVRAFNAGVNDFLSKPFNAGELMARVRAGMRIIHLEAALEKRIKLARRLNARLSTLNAELRHMASTDELTGLINRREAVARLHNLWSTAKRYGQPLSCALIDIDGFKLINDRAGHLAGDAALREVAGVLAEALRDCDIIGRFGGDEFLVIMPETAADGARDAIERCRASLADHVVGCPELAGTTLTISAGIAEVTSRVVSVEDLVRQADGALYSVKHHGKNAVSLSA